MEFSQAYLEATYKGRQISDAEDLGMGYCGSAPMSTHIAQMNDPGSWVHASHPRWARLGGWTGSEPATSSPTADEPISETAGETLTIAEIEGYTTAGRHTTTIFNNAPSKVKVVIEHEDNETTITIEEIG